MIYEALNCIEKELNLHLRDVNLPDIKAVAGNISEIAGGSSNVNEDIIITLINVEENRISRDPLNYLRAGKDIVIKNPAVHLNLTFLFSAIIKSEAAYGTALQNLQRVIQFFQKQYVFDQTNTARDHLGTGIEKLIMEMVSLNSEQLNHIWSILGGKYHPSVVYKVRMISIDSVSTEAGTLIKEIEANYHLK